MQGLKKRKKKTSLTQEVLGVFVSLALKLGRFVLTNNNDDVCKQTRLGLPYQLQRAERCDLGQEMLVQDKYEQTAG